MAVIYNNLAYGPITHLQLNSRVREPSDKQDWQVEIRRMQIANFCAQWSETMLLAVERELSSTPKVLSDNALIALEVNDALECAARRHRRFPNAGDVISYRGADLWKYQFAAPLLVTPKAAQWLYCGLSGRLKAIKHLTNFAGSKAAVVVYGEHVFPTAAQRSLLPGLLVELDDNQGLKVDLPNTKYAYELLRRNIIECCRADEALQKSKDHADDGKIRLHPDAAIVNRKWFNRKNGQNFEGRPEHLERIAARINNDHEPRTFDDFWDFHIDRSSTKGMSSPAVPTPAVGNSSRD